MSHVVSKPSPGSFQFSLRTMLLLVVVSVGLSLFVIGQSFVRQIPVEAEARKYLRDAQ